MLLLFGWWREKAATHYRGCTGCFNTHFVNRYVVLLYNIVDRESCVGYATEIGPFAEGPFYAHLFEN